MKIRVIILLCSLAWSTLSADVILGPDNKRRTSQSNVIDVAQDSDTEDVKAMRDDDQPFDFNADDFLVQEEQED